MITPVIVHVIAKVRAGFKNGSIRSVFNVFPLKQSVPVLTDRFNPAVGMVSDRLSVIFSVFLVEFLSQVSVVVIKPDLTGHQALVICSFRPQATIGCDNTVGEGPVITAIYRKIVRGAESAGHLDKHAIAVDLLQHLSPHVIPCGCQTVLFARTVKVCF